MERSSLALRGIALFDGLSEDRLTALAQACEWHVLPAHHALLTPVRDDGAVHCLVSGSVRVTTFAANGRQVTFRDCQPGEHLGDLAAIDGRPRSAEAVTLVPSVVASLSRATFLALLQQEPVVALRVMQGLAGLVRALTERVVELSTQGVQQRLQRELLRRAHEAGVQPDGRARLDPAPRHADLAAQVSTYREQVSRELGTLTRDGLVTKEGRAWSIDVAALARRLASSG
jgi:CRP-like cAMP-binding protein